MAQQNEVLLSQLQAQLQLTSVLLCRSTCPYFSFWYSREPSGTAVPSEGTTHPTEHSLMLTDTAHADANVCLCSHPFMYFPTFYTVKSLVERQPHPLEHAYNKWRNEIWDSCKALWTLWVPAQVINFAFVPRYLRVPFGASALAAFIFVICCCSSSASWHLYRDTCGWHVVRQLLLLSFSSSAAALPLLLCFCATLHASAWVHQLFLLLLLLFT